ncbi:MAG: CoA pyrophosphatase [Paracoccaceae bacterium]
MTPPDSFDRIRRLLETPAAATSDFDLNPEISLPPNRKLRPAAVLLALQPSDRGIQVVLTKRASSLRHHPGQIAFAGGKVEETDADAVQAALREAREEIGLPSNNVEILGTLPPHETVTGFSVTPVVARISQPFTPTPQPGEVQEVFFVPLAHVTNLNRFQIQSRRWQGSRRYYHTVPYGPYYIWGATARILHAFGQRLAA